MRYEMKKLFSNKIILIGILGLIMYCIYYSYTQYSFELSDKNNKINAIYYGEYTEEKHKLIEDKMGEITEEDDMFFSYLNCYSQIRNYKSVLEYRKNVLNNAKRLKDSSDAYVAKTNENIEKIFNKEIVFEITDISKIKNVTDVYSVLNIVDIINVILIIISVCAIFIIEHTAKTHKVVFSSYRGRLITYTRKVVCIILFAFLLSVITSICLCLLTYNLGTIDSWLLPIQSVELYMYAPHNINLLVFVINLTIIRGIGYMAIGIICIFVTLFFKRSIFPIIINSVIFVGGLLLYGFYSEYSVGTQSIIESKYKVYCKIKGYSMFGLLNHNGALLEQYETINFFGFSIEVVYFNILINVILMFVVATLGYVVYRRKGMQC